MNNNNDLLHHSHTTQKKQKINYWMISTIILGTILITLIGLFASTLSVTRDNHPDLIKATSEPGKDDGLSSSSAQETYKSVVLLDIPWGSESSQVGLFEHKGLDAGPNQVPQSFDVDKDGNVFILDSVNMRVVRYNPKGKFLGSFPVGVRDDIRIAPDGSLYLLGYGQHVVLHYSDDGKLLERIPIPREIEEPFIGLYFDAFGRLMIGHIEWEKPTGKNRVERYSLLRSNGATLHSYDGMPSSAAMTFYAYFANDRLKGIMRVYDSTNTLKETINLDFPSVLREKQPYVYFMGVDRREYLYFYASVESENVKGSEDVLLKYDQKGALVASVSATEPIIRSGAISRIMGSVFIRYRVHPRGDIYFVYPLKSSFVLVKSFTQGRE